MSRVSPSRAEVGVRLTVNGQSVDVAPEPERSLLHLLREEMQLVAAKPGCGEGACGACTVLLDGQPIRSCVRPVAQADGHPIDTLEGLRTQRTWAAVIDAFSEIRAFQCGFCTPGMVVAAGALLRDNAHPSDAEIVEALDGNVCRCGTYPRILRAVHRAADLLTSDTRPDKVHASQSLADSRLVERPAIPWDLAQAGERNYFERLGDGLVVVLAPDETEHVNEPRGAWSASGGAWLHVGVDGAVTAFTGKVDVGQDNRTELTGMVAAEMERPRRTRRAGHGRHRLRAIRHGHLWQPLDGRCRWRAARRRGDGARVAGGQRHSRQRHLPPRVRIRQSGRGRPRQRAGWASERGGHCRRDSALHERPRPARHAPRSVSSGRRRSAPSWSRQT